MLTVKKKTANFLRNDWETKQAQAMREIWNLLTTHKKMKILIRDEHVFNVRGASQFLGITPEHVRRLCREGKLGHVAQGGGKCYAHFLFLPWQLREWFQ